VADSKKKKTPEKAKGGIMAEAKKKAVAMEAANA
jgi:hypothetical protein